MQAPSLRLQLPSSLQRPELRQSPALNAAHLPSRTPHLPSLAHTLELLQLSSLATHLPSLATHCEACLQTSDFLQSASLAAASVERAR